MTTFINRIFGFIQSQGVPIGCLACGATGDEPCKLDKGDGVCPEISAPRGTKAQHGNDVAPYEPFPDGAGIDVLWSR